MHSEESENIASRNNNEEYLSSAGLNEALADGKQSHL
jgi:hypothetical protein